MKHLINEILQDLYVIDPSLQQEEKKIQKVIAEMIALQPDTQFSDAFKHALQQKLLHQIGYAKKRSVAQVSLIDIVWQWLYRRKFAWGTIAIASLFVVLLPLRKENTSVDFETNVQQKIQQSPMSENTSWTTKSEKSIPVVTQKASPKGEKKKQIPPVPDTTEIDTTTVTMQRSLPQETNTVVVPTAFSVGEESIEMDAAVSDVDAILMQADMIATTGEVPTEITGELLQVETTFLTTGALEIIIQKNNFTSQWCDHSGTCYLTAQDGTMYPYKETIFNAVEDLLFKYGKEIENRRIE